jgi:hypothetical protein
VVESGRLGRNRGGQRIRESHFWNRMQLSLPDCGRSEGSGAPALRGARRFSRGRGGATLWCQRPCLFPWLLAHLAVVLKRKASTIRGGQGTEGGKKHGRGRKGQGGCLARPGCSVTSINWKLLRAAPAAFRSPHLATGANSLCLNIRARRAERELSTRGTLGQVPGVNHEQLSWPV